MMGSRTRVPCCLRALAQSCLLATATIACGNGTQKPTNVMPAPAAHVTGAERLEWTQTAADNRELSRFRYAAYVDGVRVELTAVSCRPLSPSASAGFDCSAPLPSMSDGGHVVEIATFIVDGDIVLESRRSAMNVMKTAR
jgi:hypothetical protein